MIKGGMKWRREEVSSSKVDEVYQGGGEKKEVNNTQRTTRVSRYRTPPRKMNSVCSNAKI